MILFYDSNDEYGCFNERVVNRFSAMEGYFENVIQYYVYCKSRCFDDKEAASEIMYTTDSQDLKLLARRIKGFDEKFWETQAGAILYRGLKGKFDEYPELVGKLVGTDDEILVFCDPKDPELGIGMRKNDPDVSDMSKWKGKNLLGYTLMALREYYKAFMPEAALSPWNKRAHFVLTNEEFRYDPYEGDEPYIYLNYSPANKDDAKWLGEILKRRGYHVWYDKELLIGRLWTGRRARAVQNCMAVVKFDTGEKNRSPFEQFVTFYSDALKIPCIFVITEHPDWEDDDMFIYSELSDETLPDRLDNRLRPIKESAEEKARKEKDRIEESEDEDSDATSEKNVDLVISYNSDKVCCRVNVRTGEKFDDKGNRVMAENEISCGYKEPAYANTEEIYRAMLGKVTGYEVVPLSPERDYIGTPVDWAFCKRIVNLKSGLDPVIEKEIEEKKRRKREASEGYPYMDEFEYLDSLYDE